MEDLYYWVWLSRIKNLGNIRMKKILKLFHNPKAIWNLKRKELLNIEGIGEKTADEILNPIYRKGINKIIRDMEKEKVSLITINNKEYPKNLKEIYDSPIILYVKGNKEILDEFSLAIIGCRDNSEYGRKVAEAIAKGLVKNNIITVSGLARGIDSISQNATVKANGKTIAVIGSGLDIIYPYENKKLAQEIIDNGGAIISEYPLGTKPERLHFPARNRIISGMSSGVIVIEAKNKSGTMITVDFALEQGKNVFVIPRKYNK